MGPLSLYVLGDAAAGPWTTLCVTLAWITRHSIAQFHIYFVSFNSYQVRQVMYLI